MAQPDLLDEFTRDGKLFTYTQLLMSYQYLWEDSIHKVMSPPSKERYRRFGPPS
jgi:hypothetical protein